MLPVNLNLAAVMYVEKIRVHHPPDTELLILNDQRLSLTNQFKVILTTQAGFFINLYQGLDIGRAFNIAANPGPSPLVGTHLLTAAQEQYLPPGFKEAGNNLFFLEVSYLIHPLKVFMVTLSPLSPSLYWMQLLTLGDDSFNLDFLSIIEYFFDQKPEQVLFTSEVQAI